MLNTSPASPFPSFIPPLMNTTSIIVALSSLLIVLFLWVRKPKAFWAFLPPGPKPVLLLGNILDITLKELWLPAYDWAKQYGAGHLILIKCVKPVSRRCRIYPRFRTEFCLPQFRRGSVWLVGQAWVNIFRQALLGNGGRVVSISFRFPFHDYVFNYYWPPDRCGCQNMVGFRYLSSHRL